MLGNISVFPLAPANGRMKLIKTTNVQKSAAGITSSVQKIGHT